MIYYYNPLFVQKPHLLSLTHRQKCNIFVDVYCTVAALDQFQNLLVSINLTHRKARVTKLW